MYGNKPAAAPVRKFFQRRVEPYISNRRDAIDAVRRIEWFSAKAGSSKDVADRISYQMAVETWSRALIIYLETAD